MGILGILIGFIGAVIGLATGLFAGAFGLVMGLFGLLLPFVVLPVYLGAVLEHFSHSPTLPHHMKGTADA